MRRSAQLVLMLCIGMMCTNSFEVQGQNRRTEGQRTEYRSGHSNSHNNRSFNSGHHDRLQDTHRPAAYRKTPPPPPASAHRQTPPPAPPHRDYDYHYRPEPFHYSGGALVHTIANIAVAAIIADNIADRNRAAQECRVVRENCTAGTLVRSLPDNYEEVTIDGEVYYRTSNVLYKATAYRGEPYFEIVAIL